MADTFMKRFRGALTQAELDRFEGLGQMRDGFVIFNLDDDEFQRRAAGVWTAISGGGSGGYGEPGLIKYAEPDNIVVGGIGFDAQNPMAIVTDRALDIGGNDAVVLQVDTDNVGTYDIEATEVAGGGPLQNGFSTWVWFDIGAAAIVMPLGGFPQDIMATIKIRDLTTPIPHDPLDTFSIRVTPGGGPP